MILRPAANGALRPVCVRSPHPRTAISEKVTMTAGQSIKDAGESISKATDHVVDAVEGKVNTVTDAVEDALRTAADKIHAAAGQPASVPAAK